MPCRRACTNTVQCVRTYRTLVPMRKASSRASAPLSLTNESVSGYALKSLKDIPGPSPSIPFFGTSWQYLPMVGRYRYSRLHDSYLDKFKRYGPVVREEFRWRTPVVHLYDPADFQTVFRHQGRQPERPISDFIKHYRMDNPDKYDSPGLANSVGDEWEKLRDILKRILLQLNSLGGLQEVMDIICNDFVHLLRTTRDPETNMIHSVQEVANRLALESVYMLTLDTRLGCLEADLKPNTAAFNMIYSVKLLFEAFQGLFYKLPIWRYFKTPSYQKLEKAESTMYKATSERIQEAIQKLRETGSLRRNDDEKPSILESLLMEKELTDKEIRTTVIDFISGGIFTVTNAFTFLLYNISQNPEVQEKLYQEVKRIAPDGVITTPRIAKLRYLKACVRESFRLTPTIPCITRILSDNIKASGYHIPAGTPIFCHFSVASKQPDKYPDPDSFVPERWLSKTEKTCWSLMPFGFGHRMCVGRIFAEMELHTALAKLVYNFKIESTSQKLKCEHVFIVVPTEPVSLILRDR